MKESNYNHTYSKIHIYKIYTYFGVKVRVTYLLDMCHDSPDSVNRHIYHISKIETILVTKHHLQIWKISKISKISKYLKNLKISENIKISRNLQNLEHFPKIEKQNFLFEKNIRG